MKLRILRYVIKMNKNKKSNLILSIFFLVVVTFTFLAGYLRASSVLTYYFIDTGLTENYLSRYGNIGLLYMIISFLVVLGALVYFYIKSLRK